MNAKTNSTSILIWFCIFFRFRSVRENKPRDSRENLLVWPLITMKHWLILYSKFDTKDKQKSQTAKNALLLTCYIILGLNTKNQCRISGICASHFSSDMKKRKNYEGKNDSCEYSAHFFNQNPSSVTVYCPILKNCRTQSFTMEIFSVNWHFDILWNIANSHQFLLNFAIIFEEVNSLHILSVVNGGLEPGDPLSLCFAW